MALPGIGQTPRGLEAALIQYNVSLSINLQEGKIQIKKIMYKECYIF
jgi:hypothetical protein